MRGGWFGGQLGVVVVKEWNKWKRKEWYHGEREESEVRLQSVCCWHEKNASNVCTEILWSFTGAIKDGCPAWWNLLQRHLRDNHLQPGTPVRGASRVWQGSQVLQKHPARPSQLRWLSVFLLLSSLYSVCGVCSRAQIVESNRSVCAEYQ